MLQFNEQADRSRIYLHVGQKFEVILQENPTTGFRWNPISSGEPVCNLLDNSFDLDENTIGSGGSHYWLFQAVKEGSGKIDLVYSRSWEQDKPPARASL
ncbi:MAG TPA: protease inhibitor I42 family protein [Ktedonobacteraceae bacterium]|nr:protease inhibitor I42 family protein [Ktedonobacteraceae bacterium]